VNVRQPSRPILACAGVCALILIVAAIDLVHTNGRLPDAHARACRPDDASCLNAELSERLASDRAADPLQDEYNTRGWLYSFGILATTAIATAYALRASPKTRWPRIFTNLGVIGVWSGIAAVGLLAATDGSSVQPPPAPVLLVPVMLLLAAAVGTLMAREERWGEEGSQMDGVRDRVVEIGKFAIHVGTGGQLRRSRLDQLARWLSLVAAALTAVACTSALIVGLAQPSCGNGLGPPGWTSFFVAITAVAAIGATAAAVGALVLRHWIIALVALVACPIAALSVLVSTCAFY
jgi:hypothetical protein